MMARVRLRKGNSFPVAKDQMINYNVLKDYFNLLEKTLQTLCLRISQLKFTAVTSWGYL